MRIRLALFLLLPLGALAAPKRPADTDQTFAALERAWSAAYLKHDLPTIERLLAEEFVGIDGRGVMSVRADELAEARARPPDAPPLPVPPTLGPVQGTGEFRFSMRQGLL